MVDILKSCNYSISNIKKEEIDEVLELADIVFKDSGMDNKSYINGVVDWDISVKLTYEGKIIGFYIFNTMSITTKNDKYSGDGLHGVALGINSEYKGMGLGKMLINYPLINMNNDYDYIWGMHLKSLKNIDDWLKRRELVSDNGLYVTATLLN